MHFTMRFSIQRKTANLSALLFVITAQLNLSLTEMSVAILLSLRNPSQFSTSQTASSLRLPGMLQLFWAQMVGVSCKFFPLKHINDPLAIIH